MEEKMDLMEELNERQELVTQRILEIATENVMPEKFQKYFCEISNLLMQTNEIYQEAVTGKLKEQTACQGKERQEKLFAKLMKDAYEESFLNPSYAISELGETLGGLLSMLYADMVGTISYAYEGKTEIYTILLELFVQVYGCFTTEVEDCGNNDSFDEENVKKNVNEVIYWFYHDYQEVFITNSVEEMLNPKLSYCANFIKTADLMKPDYLYQYGLYIGENELGLQKFLSQMPQSEIDAMAATFTNGFKKGFEAAGKDMTKKDVVSMEYPIGMERVALAAMKQFETMGLHTVVRKESVLSGTGRGNGKRGAYATALNRQFDYDHKDDKAYYFDKSHVERGLEVLKDVYEKNKAQALKFAGPAVIECFGEPLFDPKNKKENKTYSDKQNELKVYQSSMSGQIVNEYIPGDEYSFTIIAYPVPEIGEKFEEIFEKTVELNNLDYELYQRMQQNIIDTLDKGNRVHVVGKGDNHTDIWVQLYPLKDRSKETIFENCVADVNIPVGEVFTSPVLENTNGVLHVTQVYLEGFCYKDLEITFKDGCITSYTCKNFETEEENKKYVFDNVLFRHKTLPLGEFAIGTNTTAYKMGRDYDIAAQLPILIAEKTGPHFAVGDTCYSHAEDVAMFNPDGKECVARENTFSRMRNEDMSKAYFNCHTDITIPYDELGEISVHCEDGSSYPIILDGKFVVPGTEELNKPLEEI